MVEQPPDQHGSSRQQSRPARASKRLTPHEELQLLEAHRSGDAEALLTLIRSYQKRVFSVCYRMLGDIHQAEDVAQDALIRVLEGLESYNGQSRLSTWVIRVTMNSCLSHLRREKLRRHASLDSGSDHDGDDDGGRSLGARLAAPGEPSSGSRIEQNDDAQLLEMALTALDPEVRAILVLRDVQGLEYQQIGIVVDAPVGTVKSRLFRARAALREAVEVERQRREQVADGRRDARLAD